MTDQPKPPTNRPRHNWLRRLTLAAVVLVATATPGLALAESDNPGDSDDVLAATPADPGLIHGPDVDVEPTTPEVAFYAADYTVTEGEARRRLDRIQPLQAILASIRRIESARLAGWGIDHQGPFRGWVWLTGDEPPSTQASAIADAHTDVEIRTGATHTYAELRAARSEMLGGASVRRDPPDGVLPADVRPLVTFTGISMRDNAVRIGIDPTKPTGDAARASDADVAAAAAKITSALQGIVTVNFKIEDGRGIGAAEDFKGGQTIGNASRTCTSGFAARENGKGAYGIITAGHCGDDGPNESITFFMHQVILPFDYGWASKRADAQFHTIPTGDGHRLHNKYLCHDTPPIHYCDVTGDIDRLDMVDDYVCHAGVKSGVSCGEVSDIDIVPDHDSACLSAKNEEVECDGVFVQIYGKTLEGCRGDSGGPVYQLGKAYGILMTATDATDCEATGKTVTFSAIREVEDFLGVQILIAGPVTVD